MGYFAELHPLITRATPRYLNPNLPRVDGLLNWLDLLGSHGKISLYCCMESVAFTGAFEDGDKHVELVFMRGGYYHIFIDRYYKGQIIFQRGEWAVCPQNESIWSADDKDAILDRVR